jgi:Divergent InlB B-repeat domain
VQDSLWLHRLDETPVALTVAFAGAGTVTSDLPGVNCTVGCTTQWDPGTVVSLDAEPAANDRFVRWTGACTGRGSCRLTLVQAATVGAVYGPLRIPVRVSTSGKGRVACTPACSRSFKAGSTLRLKAVPATGWRFAGWSGACKGTRPTCTPATDYAVAAGARFTRR